MVEDDRERNLGATGYDRLPMSTRQPPGDTATPTELIGPPAPPPDKPPPDRELWPWLLVLGLLVLAGIAAAWYATRDSGAARPETAQTTVPHAKPRALKKHTTTAATTTRPQPQTVVVPDLIGQNRDDAVRTLEADGLTPDVHGVPSTQQTDTVISQHPAGGTRVSADSGVLLNVAHAVAKPKPAKPKATTPRATPPTPKHEQPKPKKENETNTPTTTSGAGSGAPQTPATTVPSVVGEDEATAQSDIAGAGLTSATVDQATTDPSQDGMVVDQSPPGGSTAQPDSQVTIYVARYSEPTTT
jgi:PASTA domain-containing protein